MLVLTNEDLLPLDTTVADGLSNLLLVTVHFGSVDMTVKSIRRGLRKRDRNRTDSHA